MKLKEKYQKEVIPEMQKRFHLKNAMAVPRIEKVVLNTSFGRLMSEMKSGQEKVQEAILRDLDAIGGQKSVLTYSKKAIAAFKIRKNQAIGVKTTLRGKKMYDFLERLINIALPRSRDFQGIDPDSIDGRGNLTVAFKEQVVFPEILPEKANIVFGLEATIGTSAKNQEEALALFSLMRFPMRVKNKK